MEPLPNLSEQSARIGTWLLSVATPPRVEEYTYGKGSGKGKGNSRKQILAQSEDRASLAQANFALASRKQILVAGLIS